jgi:hypothetical protein
VINISNPEEKLLLGLKHESNELENYAGNTIYLIYKNTIKNLSSYARFSLSIQNIFEMPLSTRDLFSDNSLYISKGVYWAIDNEEYALFKYKIPEGQIHPMFTGDNLLTPDSWEKLQTFISKNNFITEDVSNLLELKQKAFLGEGHIPAIEACAIIEYKLREKIKQILLIQGISNNKIENSKKDVTLSLLLNILTPLVLGKKDFLNIKNDLLKVDNLRTIRNDIIHDRLSNKTINHKDVYEGISSGIKVLMFLQKKFNTY